MMKVNAIKKEWDPATVLMIVILIILIIWFIMRVVN